MKTVLFAPNHPGMKGLPLGLCSVALSTRAAGIDVEVLDLANLDLQAEGVETGLKREDVDVAGITGSTPTYRYAIELANAIKRAKPRCVVVLGGIHAGFCDESILQHHEEIDFVVREEGEQVFPRLCVAIRD